MEEKATLVSLWEYGNVNNMDSKGSYFCSSYYYFQPSDSWDIENITLAYEDCRMKDNGEGKKFTPSFSIGEPKISAEEGEVVNDDNGYFGLDTKE